MKSKETTANIAETLERKNVENILLKQKAGKVLSDAEKQQVAEWVASDHDARSGGKSGVSKAASDPAVRKLHPRKRHFAELVASGLPQAQAFRIAFKHPKISSKAAATRGSKAASDPAVRAFIDDLQRRSASKTILSLNDRLSLLAKSAQHPPKTAADRNAQARVIEVYSKISGDQAPDRTENTTTIKTDSPIEVAVVRLTRSEKATRMLADLNARKAAEKAVKQATPPAVVQ